MIKQIAAKKVDTILTRNLSSYAFLKIMTSFPPADEKRQPLSKKFIQKAGMLPPLLAKSQNQSIILPSPLPKSPDDQSGLPEPEEGYLLMGDVVTLIAIETQDMSSPSGVITGDGIAHNYLDCIPMSTFINSDKVQFRLSLFRIEPLRQYGYSSMLKTYKKLNNPKELLIDKLKQAEEEEHMDNETEAEVEFGKVLTFGELIQLRHIHSNSFLTTSKGVSKERGCLLVELDPMGNEGSWLELSSGSLIRQDGEAIRLSDRFCLTLNKDNAKYYLHMGVPKSWKDDVDYELNASSNFTYWQVRRFISHATIRQNPGFVATGDSFRIMYKQTEGFLSITPRAVDEILPDSDTDLTKVSKPREKKESTSQIVVENHKSCLSVWELVKENPFIGGLAEKESLYRIKHIATGLMLCVNMAGHIYLTYERNLKQSLFRIIQEPSDTPFHTFNTLIKLESPSIKKVFIVSPADLSENLFSTSEKSSDLQVSTSINRKQDTRTTFSLYDEPESSTIFIYQISSLFPRLVVFYNYIKVWGYVKRGNSYISNFELAKATEAELEAQVSFLLKILSKIKKSVYKEDLELEERQNTLRLTGFVEIMMRFVILLDKKLELPAKFPVDALPKQLRRSKVRLITEGPKHLKPEFLQFPAVIGLKHFSHLAKELYGILYHCIKDNIDSCTELEKYQEFLSSQLFSYKDQVGVLIKEFYKMSSGTIAKQNPMLFKVWIDQLKPVNEIDENIDEQIITLKILASLCKSFSKGIPGNQNIISQNFFSENRDYVILKSYIDEGKPFLALMTDKNTSLTDFLQNNPTLSNIAMEDKSKFLLIYLNEINTNRQLLIYFSSLYEFLVKLCLSRNEAAIVKVTETMLISFNYILAVISDKNIHCKLRTQFVKLLWVMFFDKEGKYSLSEAKERCFLWDHSSKTTEEHIEDSSRNQGIFDKIDKKRIPLEQAIAWVEELWSSDELPVNSTEAETLADQVRFVIEIIKITTNFISFGYMKSEFVNSITLNIMLLIDPTQSSTGRGWIGKFKAKFSMLRNEKLICEFIQTIIDFFQIKFFAKVDQDVKSMILEFGNKDEAKEEVNDDGDNLLGVFNKKQLSEENDEIAEGVDKDDYEIASLDTLLLNLLFNYSEDSLKERIIRLLLSNLSFDKKLLESLNDVILIPQCPMREIFVNVKTSVTEIEKGLNRIMFLEPQILFDGLTQENPEIIRIREAIQHIVKSLKYQLSKKFKQSDRLAIQKICKNLRLDSTCLRFFIDDWPWIERSGPKLKIQSNVNELYIYLAKLLRNFVYNNSENQQLLYDYLPHLDVFKANYASMKILMAEVVKCRKNSQNSLKVIEIQFRALSARKAPMERPEDILILESLIHDENLKFFYMNQTAIIKNLLLTQNLHSVFSCDTSWDLSKYSSKSIKFFSMMIDIIARCSIFNEFGTHQARRMMPYKVILREIGNTSMLLVKKAYLHFLFYVFFMKSDNIERELLDENIEDILGNIILPDVSKYKLFIDHFIVISLKGMYDPVVLSTLYTNPVKNASNFENKRMKPSKIDSLTREQAESLEYWRYLNSHKPDTPRISTGLICVIKDITQEYKLGEFFPEPIAILLFKIKCELQEMLDALYNKMYQCEEINMDFMIQEIALTMLEIPYFYINIKETEQKSYEDKIYQNLLNLLSEFIQKSHLPFAEFFETYMTFENDMVTRYEFFYLIKKTMKLAISVCDLEVVCKVLEPNMALDVTLTKLLQDLKGIFIGKAYVVRKEREPVDPPVVLSHEDVTNSFKEYFSELVKVIEEGDNNIALMVDNVKIHLIDPALAKNDSEVLRKFVRNLSKAFHKPEHKIFLIDILKFILKREIDQATEELEHQRHVDTIQMLYINENVISICFQELQRDNALENVSSALDLLIHLMTNNNPLSKQRILDYLKLQGFAIFSYIRSQLRETQDILATSSANLNKSHKRTLGKSQPSLKSMTKNLRSVRLSQKILLFLQTCCNNCFLPFQEFLQIQNPENPVANIDLVSEMCQFLIRMQGLSDLKGSESGSNEISDLAIQCLRSLADCCQGPCFMNQLLLGQRRRLYEFMNWVFINPSPNFSANSVWLDVYNEAINLLNALIEANKSLKVAKIFIREIDLELLSLHATMIWKQIVQGRERLIYQDNQGPSIVALECLEMSGIHLEQFEKETIEIGFGIYILILTLQYLHPVECSIKLGTRLKQVDQLEKSQSLRPGFREMIRERFSAFFSKKVQDIDQLNLASAQDFYYSNISSVEINNRDQLAKLFFRVPTMCRYLTFKSQRDIVIKINRASHQEKIEDFCNKSKIYEVEMSHQQKLAKYPLIDAFVSKWRVYGKVSYLMVIIINIILLSSVEHEEGRDGDWMFSAKINASALLNTVGAVQITLASLVYMCYIIEYLPVIKYRSKLKSKGAQSLRYTTSYFNRIKGTELMKEILIRTRPTESKYFSEILATLEMIFFDFDCVYNMTYLIISILCWKYSLLYCVLLLDLIKRNEDLKNILRSITLNGKQLILTTLLGIIVIYIFSIIAFLDLSSFYSADFTSVSAINYCGTLIECFQSSTLTGIRQGGGIGDALIQPQITDSKYWALMVFNILYFAIVINILLNIVFGIIIDTFGELRDQHAAQEKDIKENCFICGNQRFLFEIRRIKWAVHITMEHNYMAYLAFLIYIRHKPIDACSGAEKYVKEKLEKNETSFFPLTSLSLENGNEEQKEEMVEMQMKVEKILAMVEVLTAK